MFFFAVSFFGRGEKQVRFSTLASRARLPDGADMATSGQAYACLLGQKHPSMALPELRALCEAAGGSAQPWPGQGQMAAVCMPSDAAMTAVVERATLTKCALVLWASGSTVDDAARAWASVSAATVAEQAGATFRFEVYSPHRKLSNDDKRELMLRFPLVPLTAKLDSPQLVCWLLLLDGQVSIGRQVAVQAKGDSLWPAYRLSSRPYVGPTSMDPELTFVMANFAGAGPCSLVLDPFCGTGSTLLPCAHFGATTTRISNPNPNPNPKPNSNPNLKPSPNQSPDPNRNPNPTQVHTRWAPTSTRARSTAVSTGGRTGAASTCAPTLRTTGCARRACSSATCFAACGVPQCGTPS